MQSPAAVVIYVPDRPPIDKCPEKVIIEGDIVGSTIVLKLADAEKLRSWINNYMACSEKARVVLNGHIEKLENRLRAIGGK